MSNLPVSFTSAAELIVTEWREAFVLMIDLYLHCLRCQNMHKGGFDYADN